MNGNGNINLDREGFGDITHRKNVRYLSDKELADYREAFRRVYAINDNRGYQYFAGIHGLPNPAQCEHGNNLFLPWHRAYLYDFEKALQEQVPGVTIPYWDWTSEKSRRNGIPRAFTEEETPAGESNPLARARILFSDDPDWMTRREPGDPRDLSRFTDELQEAMEAADFFVMTKLLENPFHNSVHGWVGGDVSRTHFAAYDPIFWSLHGFIDKLWADWQRAHPDAVTPNWDSVLTPFNMTVGTTVDYRTRLGYDYVADEIFEKFVKESTEEGLRMFNGSPTQATLPQHEQDFKSATLEFHNVHHSAETYELRIFINEEDADESTRLYENPHYAGCFYFFGKGEICTGDEGHCDLPGERKKFDLRGPHHLTPYKMYKDVTKCMKEVGKEKEAVSVRVVCVDKYGKKFEDGIEFEGLSLIYRD